MKAVGLWMALAVVSVSMFAIYDGWISTIFGFMVGWSIVSVAKTAYNHGYEEGYINCTKIHERHQWNP